MIISHKYRYVFVELPLTGSTAIGAELRENYDGSPVLSKHATYLDFLRQATADEKTYFTFSCIRNPLDQAVSYYFKYKTDHKSRYTLRAGRRGFRGVYHAIVRYVDQQRFWFIQRNDADFATFFLRFYRRPYSNWSVLSHPRFDDVIRFESIQNDFSRVLQRIGVEQIRPLPTVNRTSTKESRGPEFYYDRPELIRRAKMVFGPFMKTWKYDFPAAWGDVSIHWWRQAEYEVLTAFRKFYWRFLRNRV